MHRYIGYSRKFAGSRSVGRPPEYFPVYLEFGKCGCTGFVEPAPGIFSSVFMILKMWVHQVCGTGPQNIFRCIYDFENVGALGLWDRPPVYFWAFWKCRCMGLWGKFYVSSLRILKINSRISNLLDAGFLCFNQSGAFQQYQYTYIIYYSQLRVFCP